MKNFYVLLWALLVTGNLWAQKETNKAFTQQMQQTFEKVEKDRISSGLLLDYGMEFINLTAFDGKVDNPLYTDKVVFTQMYNTLVTSIINNKAVGFVTPQDFQKNWREKRKPGNMVLSGMFFNYHLYQEDAYPSKINYDASTQQFSDKYVNGIWQNPYEAKNIFVIAPPILAYKGLECNLILPEDIFYTNQQEEIDNIEIDVDDGKSFQSLNYNTPILVQYSSAGEKTWKFKLHLKNGNILYSQTKIKFKEGLKTIPLGNLKSVQTWNCNGSDIYELEVEAELSYEGMKGTAKILLDDAGNDCQITNPLIVVEGFDVGNLLNPESVYGTTDLESFKTGIQFSGSLNLRNTIIDNEEYDIIYVNWDNGMDFMQRNAYVLEEVIAWVNEIKVPSAAQNVVLGQSMGGTIARYALADMEERGINHDTRLFVSQDAPQQGANMPLGLQYAYRHLINQYIEIDNTYIGTNGLFLGGIVTVPIIEGMIGIDEYLSILDMPASRQLLQDWVNLNYTIDRNLHEDFYEEIRNLNNNGGYPQMYGIKNIAISNGSECGETQNLAESGNLLNLRATARGGSVLNTLFSPFLAASYFTLGITVDTDFLVVAIAQIIPGRNAKYTANFSAHAVNNPGDRLYRGRLQFKKEILFIFNSTIDIMSKDVNQPQSITLKKDNYAGGFFDLQSYVANSSNEWDLNDFFQTQNIELSDWLESFVEHNGPSYSYNLTVANQFNFIPTPSALDIGRNTIVLNDNDYRRAYIGGQPPLSPLNSPFENFTTAFNTTNINNNEEHLQFTRRNGDWLAAELSEVGYTTDCSFVCSNTNIVGPSYICNTSTTYSVPGGADSYQWSVSNSLVAETLSNTISNTITIRRRDNNSGWITLRVFIQSDRCGDVTLEKRVYVGAPTVKNVELYTGPHQAHFSPLDTENSCGEIPLQVNFEPNNSNVQDIQWERITPDIHWSIEYDSNFDGNVFYLFPTCNKTFEFRVKTLNACGWSDWQNIEYNITSCNQNCSTGGNTSSTLIGDCFEVYPVPASTNLIVKIKDIDVLTSLPSNFNVKLFHNNGGFNALVRNENSTVNPINIDVNNLQSGNYIVRAEYNNCVETFQVIIN